MDQIPITSLTPENTPPADKSIRAIVSLSWPYSSSTRQCALLLADPDFRLRNRKGQVRVRFTGASAEAVAKSRVGIGDEIVLGLKGAVWEQDSEATRTPGRSVDGELLYRRRLVMSVVKVEGNVDINVDAPVSPPRSPDHPIEIATPLPKAIDRLRSGLGGTAKAIPSYTYTSPAFAKRLRLSGESFLDSAYDPFAAEASNETNWTTFGNRLKWSYSEKTPSPKEVQFASDDIEAEKLSESRSPSKAQQPTDQMLPPPLPHLLTPASKATTEERQAEEEIQETPEGPSTPKLQPIQSPTLPLPSPFPMETRQMHFDVTTSPTNRRQESSTSAKANIEDLTAIVHDQINDEDVEMLDQEADAHVENVQAYLSDTEPDDELTQKLLMERHGVSTDDALEAEAVDRSSRTSHDDTLENIILHDDNHLPTEIVSEAPRTPERSTQRAKQLASGLDGTSSAPPSVHVTPQSEKEKIMAQTYRSLFGFQESPAPVPEGLKPAPRLSDMVWGRLHAAGIPTDDAQKPTSEETVQPAVPVIDESSPTEQEEPHSEKMPELPAPSSHPTQIEVIDLDSSSESEDDRPQTQIHAPLPRQRAMPKLEIQDSLADSENEDLMAQKTQSRQGGMRQPQSSKLQDVVAEEPPMEAVTELPKTVPVIEQGMSPEQLQDDFLIEEEVAWQHGDESAVQASRSSPLASPPLEISETLSSAVQATSIEPVTTRIAPAISSLLSSPPPWIPQVAGPPAVELIEDSIQNESQEIGFSRPNTQLFHTQDSVSELEAPSQTAPMTVIELGSSSVLPPATSSFGAEIAETEVLDDFAKTYEFAGNEVIEIMDTSPGLQSEVPIKPPSIYLETSLENIHAESQEQDIYLPQHTMETPLYPSLPLSPSYSQSVQEMESQQATATIPETLASALPPTPQLTQVESFTETHAPTYPLSSSQPVDVIDPSRQAEQVAEEAPTPKSQKKTPARKSLSTRLSNVPGVISPWFSPKRVSSAAEVEDGETRKQGELEGDLVVEAPGPAQVNGVTPLLTPSLVNGHSLAQSKLLQAEPLESNGFSTSLSYFTPLSKLEELLNPSSQQAHGTNTIDILAIVKKATKEPARAKKGPRDYFTIFTISDQSPSTDSDIRVEIYRPWMATLPVASVGDVILLRAFAVKSRERQPYLLSTDASAWCVWRYEEHVDGSENDGRPIWARKGGSVSGGVREEIKGPPVELGDEERQYASRLREWWRTVQIEQDADRDLDGKQNGSRLHGRVTRSVTARL